MDRVYIKMTTEEKKKLLADLSQELTESGGGPLKAPGVNPVFGEGNPDAKVLFVGEAPGFNENEQRRPFVGQAGKLLRKNLVANGFPEEDVYITNIVKFRPPENRDPTPQEIEFFQHFLDRQIEIIAPEYIVTLGRFSMYKFLGEGVSISRIHGQPRTINWEGKQVTIYPMYHPAAALRQGSVMSDFEEDFNKFRSLVNKIHEPEKPVVTITPKPKDTAQQLELI